MARDLAGLQPLKPWQDPDARPFVRTERVTRAFGATYAVDDVSLSIYQGELVNYARRLPVAAKPPCCACWRCRT